MANSASLAPSVAMTAFNSRRASMKILDTAEELVDSLDNLSICLKQIEEKYFQESASTCEGQIDKNTPLFQKLKENLDNARELNDTLKRERWRLNRREMSVELRMGELEDYKSHLKRDMTDMNQTVEILSMRVVQLENALCDEQEIQETLEAENHSLKTQLKECETKLKHAEEKSDALQTEVKGLRLQRSDSMLQKLNFEMSSKIEVLQMENQSLKEMIRRAEGSTSLPASPTFTKSEPFDTPSAAPPSSHAIKKQLTKTNSSPLSRTIDNSVVSAAVTSHISTKKDNSPSPGRRPGSPTFFGRNNSVEEYV